ncbi:MAG: hypothetical protein WCB27_02535 [Thermoguttaceae bacterium]|jgi:hypothetical protein
MRRLPLILGAILVLSLFSSARAEGDLDTIRTDVRNPPPESPSPPPAPAERPPSRDSHCDAAGREELDNAEGSLIFAGFYVGAYAVTAPFWLPRVLMSDDSSVAYFPRFPYDNTPGYLKSDAWLSSFASENVLADSPAGGSGSQPASNDPNAVAKPPNGSLVSLLVDPSSRRWAGQFRADYADNFGHLTGIGGELILETTSRFGIDTSFHYLSERLPDGDDHLNLGDCNLVYRFAQSPRAEMRTGIGANWLNDSTRTDLGFNFTYGGDFFPCRPWVLSAAIDCGTLGHAGLFRFRTTAGVIFNRFEGYAGYEYLDIGSTGTNFLIGGMRVWF